MTMVSSFTESQKNEGNEDRQLIAYNSLVFLESLRGKLPLLRVAHCSVEVSSLHFVSSPQVGAHMCFRDILGIHVSLKHA